MDINPIAKARIEELESEITDLHVIIDLQREDIVDLKTQLRVATAQIGQLHIDRNVA